MVSAALSSIGSEMLRALRILVVDDDAACLASIESFLRSDGHSIHTARGGREALDVARQCREENDRLDLSILDCDMPDLTGIETYQRLVVELPGTGGIFISGDPSDLWEEDVRAVGGFAFVPKPLKLARVRQVLVEYQRHIV